MEGRDAGNKESEGQDYRVLLEAEKNPFCKKNKDFTIKIGNPSKHCAA